MIRLVSITAIASMALSPISVSAQGTGPRNSAASYVDALNDLRNDWTVLSPRRLCLQRVGLVDTVSEGIKFQDPETMRWMLDDNFKIRPADRARGYNANSPNGSNLLSTVTRFGEEMGYVAAQTRVDLARVKAIVDALGTLKNPSVEPKNPGYANPYPVDRAQGLILRECLYEFAAKSFGIGVSDPETRYRSSLQIWQDSEGAKDYPYPESIFSLNYMATRSKLSKGDAAGAFQLSVDPVMTAALKKIPYVSNWKAGFYQHGIGTPASLPRAIEIFDAGVGDLDPIRSALLKAGVGRKAEALAQITKWRKSSWHPPEKVKQADDAYQAITSVRPDSNAVAMLKALIALPLAMAAYCSKSATNCPPSNSSGYSYATSTPDDFNAELSAQRRNDQFISDALTYRPF